MEANTEVITNEIDIIGTVKDTINSLTSSLFDSINSSVFPLLDDIVFIDGDIINSKNMQNIVGSSIQNGVLILANTLLFAFVLYYSVRLIVSHYSRKHGRSSL